MLHIIKRRHLTKGKQQLVFLWLILLHSTISSAQSPFSKTNEVSNSSSSKPILASEMDSLTANLLAEDLMKEAIVHFDAGRLPTCLTKLNEAIAINTFQQLKDILYFYRAICKSKMNRAAEAIEDYNKAVQYNPKKIKYRYYRGLAFFRIGNYAKAELDFEYSLEHQGNNADLLLKIGFLKEQNEELQAAINYYSQAIEQQPNLSEAYYLRGLLHLRVLLHEKACQDLKKASQLQHPAAEEVFQKYCGSY